MNDFTIMQINSMVPIIPPALFLSHTDSQTHLILSDILFFILVFVVCRFDFPKHLVSYL